MQNDLQTLAGSCTVPLPAGFSAPPPSTRSHGRPLALELSELLTPQPESSYLFRVSGHAWADQGIRDGDIAIVDRARSPQPSDLVISWHDSGFSLSRHWQLLPGDEPLGVITAIIHPCTP